MGAFQAFESDLFESPGIGPEAQFLDQSDQNVLPLLPVRWLEAALIRLSPQDIELALQHKIVAIAWLPTLVLYAVVGENACEEASRRRLKIVARIRPPDFRSAVRRVLGSRLLRKAVFQLALDRPEASARRPMTAKQITGLLIGLAAAVAVAPLAGLENTFLCANLLCGLFFASVISLRALCLLPDTTASAPAAPRLSDEELPVYTVLVPLFRETAVLGQLLGALRQINYPAHLLDIKLILEEDDIIMHRAVAAKILPEHFEIIVVPAGKPQTKPRALSYALLSARGSLLTIYDSEDIPDPMQLREAARVFAARDDDLACLQARLTFYNPNENWLSRQFTAEYATLFGVILPTLAAHGLPLPLGGTSNHFRVQALKRVGGWDPFNVTEDADLGFRLARAGYHTDILRSTTFEEANTTFLNWLKQRRRWLKGFLQTWLVLMRAPLQVVRETGFDGFWAIQATSIGCIVSALAYPFLLGHAVWFLTTGAASRQMVEPLQAVAVGFSLAVLVAGYGIAIASARIGLRRLGIRGWWFVVLTIPGYWLLMTLAAWLALWDFIVRPHHWHKTEHGLSAMLRRDRPHGELP